MARRCPVWIAMLAAVTLTLAVFAGEAAAAATRTASPAASCSKSAYAYAGLFANDPASGISAQVTALAAGDVPYGHVAGWIGVGGPDAGPGGVAEWLQTGLSTMAGGESDLYVEITRAGALPHYVTVDSDVQPGTSYTLSVVRLAGRPGVWQVLVDGKPAIAPLYLPGSSSFEPMAMSESWNGGMPDCNGYDYRFAALRVANSIGAWKALTNTSTIADNGFAVVDRTKAGFTALSV